jgi:hypothetical protein
VKMLCNDSDENVDLLSHLHFIEYLRSDPQGLIDFAGALYTDRSFYLSLFKGLSEDGILISQVGEALGIDDPPQEFTVDRHKAGFVRGLIDIGFEGVRDYQEVRFSF